MSVFLHRVVVGSRPHHHRLLLLSGTLHNYIFSLISLLRRAVVSSRPSAALYLPTLYLLLYRIEH
jgi:hypothetical protein